jgi:hypothetical protein
MVAQPKSIIKIFICYANEDEDLREELAKHLMLLRRIRYITGWFDCNVQAGTNWEQEIETRLDSAGLILVLVSKDFISSDYCYGVEMTRALEKQKAGTAQVIPIIVRPIDLWAWRRTPLGKFAALPKGNEPVTTWADRDTAWVAVAQEIREVVRNLLVTQPLSPEERNILYPPPEPSKKKRSLWSLLVRGSVGKLQEPTEYEVIVQPLDEPQEPTGYPVYMNIDEPQESTGYPVYTNIDEPQESTGYPVSKLPPPQPARGLTGSVIVALILLALLLGILLYFHVIVP